jgi:DNA-binding NarL/FixJ family response regulator
MSRDHTIRVALVEDDVPTREALCSLINHATGLACTVAAGSFEEALPLILDNRPDVTLLDLRLPGVSGSEGVRILRDRLPAMPVLMLTVYAEQDRIFESICNGACGYLLKKMAPEKLLESIREAHEGGSPMSPEVARKVITLFQKSPPPLPAEENLTAQEVRVLRLLADGHQYQAAAKALDISINTLRNYIRTIYDKLHVHSKSEAVSKAFRMGFIR